MFGFLAPIISAVGGMFTGGNAAATLGGIGSILGGAAGLKQANKTHPTVRENLLDQARGAREASAEYGFNPLTMLQYGQTGAGMAGSPVSGGAPLASIQMITDGLKDISDITSGDAARRRARQDLDLDLARIQLDQARSGVVLARQPATDFPGSPSPLGARAATYVQNGAIEGGRNAGLVAASAALGQGAHNNGSIGDDQLRPLSDELPVDPRREVENDPQKTHSGFMVIDNPHLPFRVHVPTMDGDEPVQWYDIPSLAGWGALSAYQHYIGRPFSERLAMPAYQAAKDAMSNLRPVREISSHDGPVVRTFGGGDGAVLYGDPFSSVR